MTSKELLNATMHLNSKYLSEADARAAAVIPADRKRIRLIPALTAAAACLSAVIGIQMYLVHNHDIGLTEQNSTSDSLVAEETEAETTASDTNESAVTTIIELTENPKKESGSEKSTTAAATAGTSKRSNAATAASKTIAVNNTDGKLRVPDFTGMTWEQAKPLAKSLGLLLTRTEINGDGAENLIHTQKPAPNSEAKPGDIIELTVFSGIPEIFTAVLEFQIPEMTDDYFSIWVCDDSESRNTWCFQGFHGSEVNASGSMRIFAEGSGCMEFEAVLRNEKNDKQARLGRYRLDFDRKTAETLESDIYGAFEQVGGLKNNTGRSSASALKTNIIFEEDNYADNSDISNISYRLNDVEISFQIPENIWGMYQIRADRNHLPGSGDLWNLCDDDADGRFELWLCEETTATIDYDFILLNLENHKEATIGRYRVDFSTETYEVLESNIEAAFAQVGSSEKPSAHAGDFDLDGRITGADRLLAELIVKSENYGVLNMLPLTEEQLACADILLGASYGSPGEADYRPLIECEAEMIGKTWKIIRECGCTGLNVEEYIANQAYYDDLQQKCYEEKWEYYKDQIDWTKLGLSGIPTYHEFKMLTDSEYLAAHTENWDLLSEEEQLRLRTECRLNDTAYKGLERETWEPDYNDAALTRASLQLTAYYLDLARQKTGEPSGIYDSPTWDELWEMIEVLAV